MRKQHMAKESLWWHDRLQEDFDPLLVVDNSDFDRSSGKTFYVTLNKHLQTFETEVVNQLQQTENLYYMVILISESKPLSFVSFVQYPRTGSGPDLVTSDRPFLPEHHRLEDRYDAFARQYRLKRLRRKALKRPVLMGLKLVSLYYKHFNQAMENPFNVDEHV